MSDEDFNTVMAKGFAQAKADNSELAKEVFADLRKLVIQMWKKTKKLFYDVE